MSKRGARKTRAMRKAVAIGGAVATVMGCPAAVAAASSSPAGPFNEMLRAMLTATGSALEYPYPGGTGNYLTSNDDFLVSGVYGSNAGQPAPPNTFQGTETFEVFDKNHQSLGSVDALVSQGMATGNPNLQVLITGVHPDNGVNLGTAAGDMPRIGSVFNWGGATPSANNVYMSLAGADPNDITGPPTTGNVIANSGLLGWVGSLGFDGTAHVDVHTALVNPDDFLLPNGDHVIAVGAPGAAPLTGALSSLNDSAAEQYDAITNTAPYAVAVQGTQLFEIVNAKGDVVGTFMGRTISTADLAGGHSYEILVLGDQTMADGSQPTDVSASDVATALGSHADQLPTTGSVFNMLYYFSPTNYGVYTDYNMAGLGPDTPNQINGSLNIFGMHFASTYGTTFDAVKNFTDGSNLFKSIPYADGALIHPVAGSEIFTGVNGMPNGGFSGTTTVVQGIKEFTWQDAEGHTGTFNADVTTFGNGSVNDVTLYVNKDQFDYTSGDLTKLSTLSPTEDLFHTVFANGDTIGGGDLPSGLVAGTEIEVANHGWYSTMTMDTNPLGDGTVTHMLSIPMFGGAWTNVPDSAYFWDSLLFSFPTL